MIRVVYLQAWEANYEVYTYEEVAQAVLPELETATGTRCYPSQERIADQLFEKIETAVQQAGRPLKSFDNFSFFIQVRGTSFRVSTSLNPS